MSDECAHCGITPGDLPYEELGLDSYDAADALFTVVGGERLCQGCAQLAGTETDDA